MDTEMDEAPPSPEIDPGEPGLNLEPRITNRAHGGVRSDKTRFIRPVERQRMRPWLIDHLDQNDIPGLVWQEQSEKIFRISWKHAANQCFNMQKDTNLFERWAIHTGRHQDSDHKRWKANFRCALNSLPDVTEMKEQGVKKGNNAFKVYRFLDEKEAKISKDGKTRKKKEPPDYKDENALVKVKEGFLMSYNTGEGTSSGADGATGSSIPHLHQLVPPISGVDLLLEAHSKDKLQPIVGGMDNLQEILAAATASLAAGGDALALEKISIEQLSRLGEVSKMKLDIRQSDRKRRKKEVSGILHVFLCNWCEKVFPTKVDLFQHFLIIHQDKLLSGEEYGARKHTQPTEKLQQEIEDLEKKVLGFTQEPYQNESEEVIEDGQVVDLSSNNSMTSQDVYIEDQVLDLSVAGALAKHPQPQSDVALDLSMSTATHKIGQKTATSKLVQKRRKSNASDVDYANKFGNYGLAGAPRTKRQLSLLLKRKEEEEEKARKNAEAQHSMEDLVHAEILISLKSGSKEENETENMEVENGDESVNIAEDGSIVKVKTDKEGNAKKELPVKVGSETEAEKVEQKMDEQAEEVQEEAAPLENVVYLELNDGSKVAVSKQIDIPLVETEKTADSEMKCMKDVPVPVDDSNEKAEAVVTNDQNGSLGKPYKCALCPQRFEDPTELLTHVSVHKTEYKCSVCTKVMTDKEVYLSHIESHLSGGKHGQICEICSVHFSTVYELQTHVKSHESGTKVYKCGNCGKAYQTVDECKNCELRCQEKVADVTADRKLTSSPLVGIKDKHKRSDKTATVTTESREMINEKGAASADVDCGTNISAEKKDNLNKNIKNTGQKNLQGEPAVNPATGSDNLTGMKNRLEEKDNTDIIKQTDSSRKCSTQESFEIPMDCLHDTENLAIQRDVRNDVVDGENQEKILEDLTKDSELKKSTETVNNSKRSDIVKENPEAAKEKIIQQSSSFNKSAKAPSDHVQFTKIRTENGTANEKVIGDAGNINAEICETDKQFKKKNAKTFGPESDLNSHKPPNKETIEDRIRKNVFHCGICEAKLRLKDVEAHLLTHKSSHIEKKIDVKIKDECTCIICDQIVPVQKFYTHLKSHSVYDLSQAQNLMLTEKEETGKSDPVKSRQPFVCNLCGFKFETFSDLKLHVNTHLGPRTVTVGDTKLIIAEQKPAVVAIKKGSCEDSPVTGKKRKESDEKRITGKRPKKKLKVSKIVKVKQDVFVEKIKKENNTDKKNETSPVIAAALKSGPKYTIRVIPTDDLKSTKNDEEAKQGLNDSKPFTDSSVSEAVKLEYGTLLVLKNGEVITKGGEDKEEQKITKRKTKTDLDSDLSKKLKLPVEDILEHPDFDPDKTYYKRSEQINERRSKETLGVTAASLLDTNSLGGNVLPATLHRLQQKILLVKDRPVKVTKPFFRPVSVSMGCLEEILSTSRPASCQTDCISTGSTSEKKDVVKTLAETSVVSVQLQTAKTVEESSKITKKQPVPVNIVKNLFHSTTVDMTEGQATKFKTVNASAQTNTGMRQLEGYNRVLFTPANVPVSTSGISKPTFRKVLVHSSAGSPSISTPMLLSSAVPKASVLKLSSSVPATRLPGALPEASIPKSSGTVLTGNMQLLQSSVANNGAPPLLSASQSVCLTVGSLQNQPRVVPAVASNKSVTPIDSKGTVIGSVSSGNITANTPPNIPATLTLLQQQQQSNMLKLMFGRVNQPPVVYKPGLTSVVIPQGSIQQTIPGVSRFPASNIIYAPQPATALQMTDISKMTAVSKPSAFQLVWLPVNQAVSADLNKTSGSVATSLSVTKTIQVSPGDRGLPLQSTVLGAKLGYSAVQTQTQSSMIQSASITASFTNQSSSPITFSSCRTFGIPQAIPSSKEKDSLVVQGLPTEKRPEDAPEVLALPVSKSLTTSDSSSAVQSERLCLACAVCKQSLSSLEEMSTHFCNMPVVTKVGQKVMSHTRLNNPGTLTDTPPSSLASDRESKAANTTCLLNQEITKPHASDSLKRISSSQGLPATTLSTLVFPNIIKTPTTLPFETGSPAHVSTAAISAVSLLCSQGSATAKSDKEIAIPHNNMVNVSEYEMDTSAVQSVDKKSEIPHSVYFLPTQTNESSTVPSKKTVSPTPLKVTTTPTTEVASNSAFNFRIAVEGSNDSDGELRFASKFGKDNSSSPSDQQDQMRSVGIHEILVMPNVVLPTLSTSEQKMAAETQTNSYGSKENISGDMHTTDVDCSSMPIVVKTTEHIITLYPCVICKKTFTFDQFRKHSHSESSRKSDIYRCCICYTIHDEETSLSQHYRSSHHCLSNHLCPADNCAQIFFEAHECDLHYAIKHQHECRFCLQRFRTYVEFQAHVIRHYKNRTLKYLLCVKCKIHFANRKSFYSHCRLSVSSKCPGSHKEKLIECKQCQCCSVNFTSDECMKLHFKRKWYQRVTYRCCICREAFSIEKEFLNHMSNHFPASDDNQLCFCHTCCIFFPYRTVLSHHMSSAEHIRAETSHQRLLEKYQLQQGDHEPAEASQTVKKKIEEQHENNGDDFELHSNISIPAEVEAGEVIEDGKECENRLSQKLYTCEQCNTSFATQFALKQHTVIRHNRVRHAPKKSFFTARPGGRYHKIKESKIIICEFCGKRFFNVKELRQHIGSSHDEKLYFACKNPDCVMTFNSIYESETHKCESLSKGAKVTENSFVWVDAGQPSLRSMKEYMLQYYVEDCKHLLDKIASTIESVQEHLGDHFMCQYCNKRFRYCQQMKSHLIDQHRDQLAQCVDCLECFFNQDMLLEHRRDCAVKGFSDEDFHTKKKLLGCDVCFNSFIHILGLTKYLRDIKFLSEKNKSSGFRCISRKGVFNLKYEGDSVIEESSSLSFNNSRKFVCISCKNEYCNAEDFYICMKSRLTVERNKLNEESREPTTDLSDETKRDSPGLGTTETASLFGKSLIDLQNVFFCNDCEVIICYEDGGICAAGLKHPCSGSNTII